MRTRRPKREKWAALRETCWQRDKSVCQHCGATVTLDTCHCDHITPLSCGGSNGMDNLRTLCPRCHVLRSDEQHRGMIARALKLGIIPADWRGLVWE